MGAMAAERVLILLNYLIDSGDGLSIREVSRRLGYSPSTVQGLVNALSAQEYVVQDEVTERYHLGPKAVQLGLAALSRLDVRNLARPHLEALSQETGETVFLAVARGNYATYIDKVISPQELRIDAPLGNDRAYNCTAVGKVLLSGMSNQELERLQAEGAFEKATERSITDLYVLHAELERVRQQGWALDNEEYKPRACCVAAPVRNHEGRIVASLTVTGPADRIMGRLDALIPQVRSHAAAISEKLGYRGS